MFLDPGHNGANDASISRQVPTGRGGTKDCQCQRHLHELPATPSTPSTGMTALRIRADPGRQLGVRTAISRGNDDALGPCVDERRRDGQRAAARRHREHPRRRRPGSRPRLPRPATRRRR